MIKEPVKSPALFSWPMTPPVTSTSDAAANGEAQPPAFIELRNVPPEFRDNPAAFIIADSAAIAYRQQCSRWEGIVEFNDQQIVKRYLAYFDEVWAVSLIQPELRATAIDF